MLGTPSEGPTLSELAKPGQVSFTQIPFQFQGKDGRNITAVVYLPSSATPSLPASLVVIAPGLNTDMNALLYAGKQLASHGYAVASLNFPFTSNTALKAMIKGTGQIPAPNTWYFQPLSVSELIDQVQSRWGRASQYQRGGSHWPITWGLHRDGSCGCRARLEALGAGLCTDG